MLQLYFLLPYEYIIVLINIIMYFEKIEILRNKIIIE